MKLSSLLIACVFAFGLAAQDAPRRKPAELADAKLGETRNVHTCGSLFLAGQFTPKDIPILKERGITRVVTLRTDGEVDWDEKGLVEAAGLDFISVPFRSGDSLTDEVFDKVRTLLADSKHKTLLHCGSANRVGGVWLPYRVLDEGVNVEAALRDAKEVGLRNEAYEKRALAYIKSVETRRSKKKVDEKSVKPGINSSFLDEALDVERFIGRFEVESREVFSARMRVLEACGVKPGQRVADIGAGTGLYTRLFSKAVGNEGWVFAVDIAPRFVEHIRKTSSEQRLRNVTTVLCHEDSVDLPPNSVDFAFICDTYHHFEYPKSTLASIHRALRPGGTLFLVEFDRIPGVSRQWILDHIRAGKDVFRGEIEAAGFKLEREIEIDGFKENYVLRFTKK